MLRVCLCFLFFFLSAYIYAEEKPKIVTDTLDNIQIIKLPDLYKVVKTPLSNFNENEMDKNLKIMAIQQGFFCKFEDLLQIKYKIPVNFGVE